jgi:hypothetical protein
VTQFIKHLNTQLITTSNYIAIINLHILQITRAHAKSLQSALTNRSLVMDLNNGDSLASVLMSLPSGYYSSAWFVHSHCIASVWTVWKTPFSKFFSIVACGFCCHGNRYVCEGVTQ